MARDDLLIMLSILKQGVSASGIMQEMGRLLFMKTHVCSCNDEACVYVPFDSQLEASVDAAQFHGFVSKMEDERVTLDFTKDQLVLSGSNARLGLSYVGRGPLFDIVESMNYSKVKWKKLPPDFIEAVLLCSFSASVDSTAGVLSGVSVEDGNVIATDNYRIGWYEMEKPVRGGFICSATALAGLMKIEPTHYSISKSWAHFKNSKGVMCSCRLLGGDYPDALKFFPDGKPPKGIELPKQLHNVILRGEVLVRDEFQSDKLMTLSFSGNAVECSVEKQHGWFKETVKLPGKQKVPRDFTIRTNPQFLDQIVKHVTTMHFLDESRVLFVSGSFKHLVALAVGDE